MQKPFTISKCVIRYQMKTRHLAFYVVIIQVASLLFDDDFDILKIIKIVKLGNGFYLQQSPAPLIEYDTKYIIGVG